MRCGYGKLHTLNLFLLFIMSESSSGPWFAVSMGLIGIIVGFGVASQSGDSGPAKVNDLPPAAADDPAPPPPPPDTSDQVPKVNKADHVRGNTKAKITIFEYSDFECSFCKRHHPTLAQLLEDYGDDVNWVYRHYPLGFHSNAQKGAESSECANELGGNDSFWEFTDMVYELGADNTKYADYAEDIGLDKAKFTECLDSGKYEDRIKEQMAGGVQAGVSGTPGNIVMNNKTGEAKLVSGAQPISNFKAIIDGMLE